MGPTQSKQKLNEEHKDESKEEPNDNNNDGNKKKKHVKPGDRVKIGDKSGTVKIVKEIDGEQKVGVELDEWDNFAKGGHGMFQANPGRGYLARLSSCNIQIPPELLEEAKRLDDEDAQNINKNNNVNSIDQYINENEDGNNNEPIECKTGDRILTARGYSGIIRYIGNVHFDDQEVIGVELDKWSPNGHDGTVHGHEYFKCIDGRGYFIRRTGIQKNFGPITRRKKSQTLNLNGVQSLVLQKNTNSFKSW